MSILLHRVDGIVAIQILAMAKIDIAWTTECCQTDSEARSIG